MRRWHGPVQVHARTTGRRNFARPTAPAGERWSPSSTNHFGFAELTSFQSAIWICGQRFAAARIAAFVAR
jgi:hypothetical protein